MNSETIVMCVVALILGMLLANMLKSVCGCKVVEGQTTATSVTCSPPDSPGFQNWMTVADRVRKVPDWNTWWNLRDFDCENNPTGQMQRITNPVKNTICAQYTQAQINVVTEFCQKNHDKCSKIPGFCLASFEDAMDAMHYANTGRHLQP